MNRRLALALVLIAFTCQSCLSQARKAADTLLDDYVKATAPPTARESSARRMRASLDELDKRVRGLPNEVPKEFVERYRRLLDATRALIAEPRDQDSETRLREYVKSITGAVPSEKEMIPASADAFLTEIARLRALLRK